MPSLQNFYTSRDNNANANTYVGQLDRLWYNPSLNSIYVSDGVTPGGIPVGLATAANAIFTNITVDGAVLGDLEITGNLSPAANNKIGGIAPGPGVVIGTNGILTIDSANLPVSFGNFYANNNILSIVNVDENMILQTDGNAEIQLIGNVGFYKPDGLPPNVANRYAQFNKDGQVTFYIPETDPQSGAFKIVGSASGNFSAPLNTGVMLQITGQNNDASRLYNDSIGSFAAFVGRRINGNVSTPTPVQAGDEIIRISSTGYDGTQIPGAGTARIVFQAMENYTTTARGSNLSFWATAVGSNTLSQVAIVDVANGVSATRFTTTGNVNANNINVTGSILGNAVTTVATIGTGNISTLNVSGNVTVSGNIRYDVASNNATVTQLTSKATAVTCNGRTGQITTSNSSIAKGEAITFTVNNTYITSVTDVPVVAFQNGATPNSYAVSVTRVQPGSFNITITNNGTGPLSDTIIINFAIIKVS